MTDTLKWTVNRDIIHNIELPEGYSEDDIEWEDLPKSG